MILELITTLNIKQGYITGLGDDEIVTVGGVPASRPVWLFDAQNMSVVQRGTSLPNGRYMFIGLDPAERYQVQARDLPPNGVDQRFEPAVWDYREPATDLTIAEQQAMWQGWANEAYQAQAQG